ncbi:MAG: copper chaperone PCu(A)C [Magnetococcales bacterium]|nr:copper chaperone PCu(A)C [Magnetococcales bacterium]
MKKFSQLVGLLVGLVALAAYADESVRIINPWVMAAPPTVQTLAAYMDIQNDAKVDMTLVQIQSPKFAKVEIHESTHTHDMAAMVPHKDLPIPSGKKVSLKPGGLHLMLINPQLAIREGDSVPLSLTFNDGIRLDVQAMVKKADGDAAESHQHSPEPMDHHGSHHDMH